ncbi:uncharacterized protein LOC133898446 [Phragmites australis]|uniref:uncharacterized protein LOC133898446 n=1 Tax=Phragmites australis TaxID=29695 RepID=UPI002D773DFE|nr:uncharacterized protein LOC133898446 [Phragmites australis]
MRSSTVLASLFFLLLATPAHGLRRMDVQLRAALGKKDIPEYSKWQQPSAGHPMHTRRASGSRRVGLAWTTPEHLTSSARAVADEDGEVKKKKMMSTRDVAPRFHEDYVGPSGHSPNHHRTIPCGPC